MTFHFSDNGECKQTADYLCAFAWQIVGCNPSRFLTSLNKLQSDSQGTALKSHTKLDTTLAIFSLRFGDSDSTLTFLS